MDNLRLKAALHKLKRLFIIIVLLIFIFGTGYYANKHRSESKARQEYEYEVKYIMALNQTAVAMKELDQQLDRITGTYIDIWKESSSKKLPLSRMGKDIGVDERVLMEYAPSGKIKSELGSNYIERGDTHTALETVKNLYKGIGVKKQVTSSLAVIEESIQKLTHPPDKYAGLFNQLLDHYALTTRYIEYAIDPSGPFSTYSNDVNSLSDELKSRYEKFQESLP